MSTNNFRNPGAVAPAVQHESAVTPKPEVRSPSVSWRVGDVHQESLTPKTPAPSCCCFIFAKNAFPVPVGTKMCTGELAAAEGVVAASMQQLQNTPTALRALHLGNHTKNVSRKLVLASNGAKWRKLMQICVALA